MNEYWDKPCAAGGLISYRYRGQYGWIMIGARNNVDALAEASRSTSELLETRKLEKWDGEKYIPAY